MTVGDPRGIGPEVTVAALRMLQEEHPEVEAVVLAPDGLALPHDLPVERVGGWDGSGAGAGRVSVEALRRGVELALSGEVHALVTGPVHKPALHAAGHLVPGQTELLRKLSGSGPVAMLMTAERTRLGSPLRVLLATTHVALREVPRLLTHPLLVEQTRILHRGLQAGWGMATPRIGLCALNPHASDGGLFGDEEGRIMEPALAELAKEGIAVAGPLPADTIFRRALEGALDAVVAPYHDVGMAAFKSVAFGSGVNATLGLPFPRTSPDHGTAFDLAGTGRADPTSTLEALLLASRLARRGF